MRSYSALKGISNALYRKALNQVLLRFILQYGSILVNCIS